MGQLQLSFLGGFQASLNGKPLTNYRSIKIQGLLIYLVLTSEHAHTRERLAGLFWPDQPDGIARKNMRQSLFRLRHLLGETHTQDGQFFHITRTTVQIKPNSVAGLDTADFLNALKRGELEIAISLYQGELLPGFSCQSQPFDDWLRQERETYHQRALEALTQLTRESLNQADFQKGQTYARRQLALEPWREEAHRQLMQALAALGERSAALVQYETCRRVLAEELGAEPTVETNNLAQRIRNDQIQRSSSQSRPNSVERLPLKIPFVGRQTEYEMLVNSYWRTKHNGLHVAILQGYAGMGKTRLAEQFLSWAATQGADVLIGRAYETGGGMPYQPLIHLLRQRIERENAPEDLLSDLWLSQLTRLLPELRDRYPDLPPPTQEENTARQHLFEAITRLGLALAAKRPLLLLIDDWHWADSGSLDLLQYVTQRWVEEKVPILLLLTLRQEALNDLPDLQNWLVQFKRNNSVQQLALTPLSPVETAGLVDLLFSRKAGLAETRSTLTLLSDWLFDETAGQPLFLTEALKILVRNGVIHPDQAEWELDWSKFDREQASSNFLKGVLDIIQGWLTRISTPAAELLRATAVLAQDATFDNLSFVASLEEDQALSALDELLKHQLLLETEEAQSWTSNPIYSFSHHKVSEAVYAEAGKARRRMLHRRAFKALQSRSAPLSTLARHAGQAGLASETIRYSLMAGNDAMSLFAVRVALTHFETVWQLIKQRGWPEEISGADRELLYRGLGRAYELTEAWSKAQETYQAMISEAQSLGATATECLGLNHLATVYTNGLGDREQTVAILEQARSLAEENGDQLGLAETELNLARALAFDNDSIGGLAHAKKGLAMARSLEHPDLLARALSLHAMIDVQLRRWPSTEVHAHEATQLFQAVGNQILAADSQRMASTSQFYSGKLQESLQSLRELYAFYMRIENLWGSSESARVLAHLQAELGQYTQALKFADEGVDQVQKMNQPMTMLDLAQAAKATVRRTVMDLEGALKILNAVLADSAERGLIGFVEDWILGELSAVHALSGDWDRASQFARKRLQVRGDQYLLPMGFTGWHETKALLYSGEHARVRSELREMEDAVTDNRRYRLIWLQSGAELAHWDGDIEQAIVHLEAALALAREIGLPGEEWPILRELSRLYSELGDKPKSKQTYQKANIIIQQLAETLDNHELKARFLSKTSAH